MKDLRRRSIPTLSDEIDIKEVPLSLIRESESLRLRQRPYPGVDALAADILARGQTTPLFVMPATAGYLNLISGYRRHDALKQLRAESAIVRIFRNLDEAQAYDLAISENQDRDALTDIERADICLRLQKEGRTAEQIATRMGWKGDRSVFRHLRVAREATPLLREALQAGRINMTGAIAFLDQAMGLPEEQQRDVLSIATEREMSAAELTRHLKRLTHTPAKRAQPSDPIRELKGGAFVINATRVEPDDPSGIVRVIELLQSALKKARRMNRSARKAKNVEVVE